MMNVETSQRLEGKVAIVTGGARGIGETTVRLFAKHGAKVVIADILDDLGITLRNDLVSESSDVIYVHCDITKDSDVKNVVDTAISMFGKLDIMFSNAGIIAAAASDYSVIDFHSETLRKLLDVNVFGSFLVAKHAARVMIPKKSGVILFNSSLVSVVAGLGPHAYAVSKCAIVGLMKNLCVELGQHGIRVNCISPTSIPTPLFTSETGMDKTSLEDVMSASGNLKGVLPSTIDIAEGALYLVSGESKFVSGINLVVDGGYSTTNQDYPRKMQEKMESLKP